MNRGEMEEEVLAATPDRAIGSPLPKESSTADGCQAGDQGLKIPAHLSFTEAEEKKHRRKLHEFKQYLVDTGVIRVLTELLLNMEESNELPDDPQQVLIDYFGEYRDPILDVIDELTKKKEFLAAEKTQMEATLESLEKTREMLQEQNRQQKLWKAMSKQGASITGLAIYQKLADRKKPKVPLKNITFTQELFMSLLGQLPQGMTAQILQHLYPTGDGECVTSANLKDDGESLILNAVISAINQFQAKDA